jgi:SAM-dependent methyltransferase
MRMAKLYGAGNIDFAQCDILDLHRLDKHYDFINCSGVLHHMGDPVAGWTSLIDRLKPGGAMMIGLYSTKARKVIFEARDEIAAQGIDSSDDGLRAFRHHTFSLPPGNKLDRLRTFKDFYTLSETRDLLFHVQEKTYDIPELQNIMDELDLEFCGFKLPYAEIADIFKQDFPDDPKMLDLKNWDAFETRNPDIFGGMYNFLCKRKGDTFNTNARNLIETGAFT